jgi:hypothetical protein
MLRAFTDSSRRDFLKVLGAAGFGAGLSGWMNVLAGHAAETKAKSKSCILLWMDGGPSHKDTFDMKPGTKDAGEYKPISTSVTGLQISEHFPKLAPLMNHAALLRGMSTPEGAHPRAKFYMHTGYREGVGGVSYPGLGSIVSKELGKPDFPMPNYVAVGNRSYGAGFLGAKHAPLIVNDPSRGVEDLKSSLTDKGFANRMGLLEEMEENFLRTQKAESIKDHEIIYQRAVKLMQSKEAKAFDLSLEPEKSKSAYGTGRFSEGCLMARRLVEVGVPFVEVTLGGWDTHQNNFERVKELSKQVDAGMSALITDLKERGLLDSTLVVWMGEFGRTPKINSRGDKPGRDHYPKAWTSMLVGGGIKGGQVVGKTDAEGATVVDRPTSGIDFMATVCQILGIDYTKENVANGRPVRIADKKAKPVDEVI